jgi:hypothetical protein
MSDGKNKKVIENLQDFIAATLDARMGGEDNKKTLMDAAYECRKILWTEVADNPNEFQDAEEIMRKILNSVRESLDKKGREEFIDTFGTENVFGVNSGKNLSDSDFGAIFSDNMQNFFSSPDVELPKIFIFRVISGQQFQDGKTSRTNGGTRAVDKLLVLGEEYGLRSTVSYVNGNHYYANVKKNDKSNVFYKLDSLNKSGVIEKEGGVSSLDNNNTLFVFVNNRYVEDVDKSFKVPLKVKNRVYEKAGIRIKSARVPIKSARIPARRRLFGMGGRRGAMTRRRAGDLFSRKTALRQPSVDITSTQNQPGLFSSNRTNASSSSMNKTFQTAYSQQPLVKQATTAKVVDKDEEILEHLKLVDGKFVYDGNDEKIKKGINGIRGIDGLERDICDNVKTTWGQKEIDRKNGVKNESLSTLLELVRSFGE